MSNELVRNKDLFYQIADVIEKDLGVYDQSLWGGHVYTSCENDPEAIEATTNHVMEQSCGTSHCIAGHAAVLSGYKPQVLKIPIPKTGIREAGMIIEINWEELISPDGVAGKHPSDVGRELLGLTIEEADLLFSEWWKPEGFDFGNEDRINAKAVAEAMRELGDGCSIWDVTSEESEY